MKMVVIHGRVRIGAKRTNLKRLNLMIQSILQSKDEVDVIVLPSYPVTGPVIGYYPPNRIRHAAKNMAERISSRGTAIGQSIGTLARWSEEYGIDMIAGPIIERAGPKLYLSILHIASTGFIEGKYRKITLTRGEEGAGLSPGKDVAVFNIHNKGKIGVFIDEDLAHSEIFRLMQSRDINIIVGFMLPYASNYFKMEHDSQLGILTMNLDTVSEFLSVRSRETGVPIILVGGGVEGGHSANHNSIAYMPTIPAEPDVGVVRNRILSYDRLDTDMLIDIDTSISKPREINPVIYKILKDICKR